MSSKIESELEKEIIDMLSGRAEDAARFLMEDWETGCLQEYANHVSIKRLNYNDHGPVHMRTVARNALKMVDILECGRKVPFAIQEEGLGDLEDVQIVVFCRCLSPRYRDGDRAGRGMSRTPPCWRSPCSTGCCREIYPKSREKQVMARCMIMEGDHRSHGHPQGAHA